MEQGEGSQQRFAVGKIAGEAGEAQSTGPGHSIGITRGNVIARLLKPGFPCVKLRLTHPMTLGKFLTFSVSSFPPKYWA